MKKADEAQKAAVMMISEEIFGSYTSRVQRIAYRAGLSSAVAMIDAFKIRVEESNPGKSKDSTSQIGQFGVQVLDGAVQAIMAAHAEIEVPAAEVTRVHVLGQLLDAATIVRSIKNLCERTDPDDHKARLGLLASIYLDACRYVSTTDAIEGMATAAAAALPEKDVGAVPENYKLLPAGARCRCVNLWEFKGRHYCCKGDK